MKKKLLLLFFFFLSVSAFSQADIVVTNSDFTNYYIPGTTTTYTVTVTNLGPNPATNVVVTNAIPTGIEYFSWWGSNNTSGVNDPLNSTIPTLAVGQTVTFTILVEIPASLIGQLVSQTVVTSSTPDPNPACAQCTDTNIRAAGADVQVVNTNNQTQYVPGTTVTYTLTVSNNGPLTAASVLVTNPVPAGIPAANFSWSGNGASGTGAALNNTIPSLESGESEVYTITVQVPAGYTGNLTSTANATSPTVDPVPGCPQCSDTDTQGFGADLEITNTDGQTTYVSGTTNIYTVTVLNNGPGVATGVQVNNAVPAGIPAANFSWVGSNASSGTGAALSDLIPTLNPGQSVVYTITVDIPAGLTAPLTSETVVTSTSVDPTPACTQCIDTDTNTFGADVVLVNTDNNVTYVPGSTNTYIVTVTNNGPLDATNVHVTNPIPAGITNFSWTGTNGSNGTNVALDNTIATLAAGTTVTYTITLSIPAGFTGPLTSVANFTTPTPDPNPGCPGCSDTDTQATAGADIVVTNSDASMMFTPGTTTSYTIMITNNGPDAATNVNVSDAVPAGIPAGNVTWTGPNGTGTGAINENFPTLAVGQTLTYVVNVGIPSGFDQETNLVNTVEVTSATPDPNPDCAACVDTDTPAPFADLVGSKSDSRADYLTNEELTYSITITNLGPSDAVNVQVSDPFPDQITQMSWTGNGASGTGPLQNVIPNLAVGQVVTYQVTIFVPLNYDLTHQTLVNTFFMNSETPDPTPACPTCTDTNQKRNRWVTVNYTTYDEEELVNDVLIHSDCATVSNINMQGFSEGSPGTSIAYFHKNNSNFPIKDGVIIGTASALGFQGQYNFGNNTPGSNMTDNQLQVISDANPGPNDPIFDAAFIEFDFTPLTDTFSFKFLFASEEYEVFQCDYGDVFAFLLTDISGPAPYPPPLNIALVPDVTPPTAVSVTTVRDNAYNSNCPSVNANWYGMHNSANPALSAINVRGQLKPMIASATVVPNTPYRIKLVIGDFRDNGVNSAVFLEGGSFNVGQTNVFDPNNSTFPDLVGDAAGCPGDVFHLQAGSSAIAGATYAWYLNDLLIPTATNYALDVTEAGIYSVIVTVGGSCQQTDSITVEFKPDMALGNPTEFLVCEGQPANLTLMNAEILNGLSPMDHFVDYFHSQQDALDNWQPIDNPTSYTAVNGETIFAGVEENEGTGCRGVRSFVIQTYPCGDPVTPDDMYLCDIDSDGVEDFDISDVPTIALGANDAADYTITVHLSQADADGDTGAIDPSVLLSGTDGQQVFVRMETVTDPTIFETTFFTLHLIALPAAPTVADVTACDSYTLPALPTGQYYNTAADGSGATIAPNTAITATQV
ncbi:choice-of-anchor L domain-containing protein, partial [Flavobacterium selenitireducens]|uniref:choice-of-anchor L domain-containing protein n=1 Tax=Flavobacterium selenitireducens TaxID=2722704 RepID=UPI00168AE1BA